jgi:hypothetical protein
LGWAIWHVIRRPGKWIGDGLLCIDHSSFPSFLSNCNWISLKSEFVSLWSRGLNSLFLWSQPEVTSPLISHIQLIHSICLSLSLSLSRRIISDLPFLSSKDPYNCSKFSRDLKRWCDGRLQMSQGNSLSHLHCFALLYCSVLHILSEIWESFSYSFSHHLLAWIWFHVFSDCFWI